MPRRVLFVCLGNICRSPLAEGVFRALAEEAGLADGLVIDSAGIGDWHAGDPPDPRAQAAARSRGIDIGRQRARQVRAADFAAFDLLLAMDESNAEALRAIAPAPHAHKVRLLLDYAPELGLREVPDPYYGGDGGFAHVLDLVETAAGGLLAVLRQDAPHSSSASSPPDRG